MSKHKTVTGYRKVHERSLASTVPIKGVRMKHVSNLTKLARVHGKIKLTCPICFIEFERYACHVTRRGQTAAYCGRGCAAIGLTKPVDRQCEICGKTYTVAQSDIKRIVTCSRECQSIKRTRDNKARERTDDEKQRLRERGRSQRKLYEFEGRSQLITQWAEEWGVNVPAARERIKRRIRRN